MLSYPAVFHKEKNKYWVEFPDLEGCLTEGDNLEEAKDYAQEALTGWLISAFNRGQDIPEPLKIKGKNVYYIEPEPKIAIPVLIRQIRKKQRLTQKEAAQKLHIKYQTYQKLENPLRFNATIGTLEKISKVFHKRLKIEFA